MLICSYCKSTKVQIKCWVDPNTNEIEVNGEEQAWCNECENDCILDETPTAIAGGE